MADTVPVPLWLAEVLSLDDIDCEGVSVSVELWLAELVVDGDSDGLSDWLTVPDVLELPDWDGVTDTVLVPLNDADCEGDSVAEALDD